MSADLETGRGRGTSDGENWEGEAPAEPSLPNEFGAQKIRHQPLAEASGMGSFRTISGDHRQRCAR